MNLTDRELATVLAALRFWQDEMAGDGQCYPEYFEEVTRLTPDEIDDLCERLNVKEAA